MFRRLTALLWSRKEMMLANKMVLANMLMPVVMVLLYQFMFKGREGSRDMIFFMVLPMIPAFIGYTLPTLVSEEAEKNNQRSLRLAGVKGWEYVLTSLAIPFLVTVLYGIGLPLYLKMDWSELGWVYLPVMILTAAALLLLYMVLALLVDNQARAGLVAMPVMMVSSFLPLLALTDKNMETMVMVTPMGALAQYTKELADYSLGHLSFLSLLAWLGLVLLGLFWIARKKSVMTN